MDTIGWIDSKRNKKIATIHLWHYVYLHILFCISIS